MTRARIARAVAETLIAGLIGGIIGGVVFGLIDGGACDPRFDKLGPMVRFLTALPERGSLLGEVCRGLNIVSDWVEEAPGGVGK